MPAFDVEEKVFSDLEQEAKKRGVTVDKLVEQAVYEFLVESNKITRFIARNKQNRAK